MHRGTMFAIVNVNEVWKSTQFNGGMGVDNLGKDCYKELENVKNLEEFKQMIVNFNKKYFEYENETLFFKADEKTHHLFLIMERFFMIILNQIIN